MFILFIVQKMFFNLIGSFWILRHRQWKETATWEKCPSRTMKAPRCQTSSCMRQKMRRRETKIQRKLSSRSSIPLSTWLLNQKMLELHQRVNDQQMRLKIQKDKSMQQWGFNQWNGADRRDSDCYLKLMDLELNQKERDLNQCKTKMQVDTVKFLGTLVSMVDGLAKDNNMNQMMLELHQRVNDQQMRLKIQKDKSMQPWRFNQWNGADRRDSDCYLKLMDLELNQKERDLNQCKTKMQVDTVKFLGTLVSMVDGLAKDNNMNQMMLELHQRVNDQQMRLKIQKDKSMQPWRFNQWNGADRRDSDCYLKLMDLELNQKERQTRQRLLPQADGQKDKLELNQLPQKERDLVQRDLKQHESNDARASSESEDADEAEDTERQVHAAMKIQSQTDATAMATSADGPGTESGISGRRCR